MLKALVFSNGVLIGRCDLYALDPPMGVVSGELEPTPAYEAIRPHVDALFRGNNNSGALKLEISTEDGRRLGAVGGVMTEDMIDDGVTEPPNVVVSGADMPSEEFKALFGADPNYVKYYGR
jgi:hypothetical protein